MPSLERLMSGFTESEKQFLAPHYRRINARRLEHLIELGLPLQQRSVLELGAGVGELTSFFLDRGCRNSSFIGNFGARCVAGGALFLRTMVRPPRPCQWSHN
jgi:hypothetical protein